MSGAAFQHLAATAPSAILPPGARDGYPDKSQNTGCGIATRMGLDRTSILALQSVGGAMGNMVAIHNIVAVCSVLGLGNQEGAILKRTVGPMLVYGLVAAAMALLLRLAGHP